MPDPDFVYNYRSPILKPKRTEEQERLAALQCAAHAHSHEELKEWLIMLGLTGTRTQERP